MRYHFIKIHKNNEEKSYCESQLNEQRRCQRDSGKITKQSTFVCHLATSVSAKCNSIGEKRRKMYNTKINNSTWRAF